MESRMERIEENIREQNQKMEDLRMSMKTRGNSSSKVGNLNGFRPIDQTTPDSSIVHQMNSPKEPSQEEPHNSHPYPVQAPRNSPQTQNFGNITQTTAYQQEKIIKCPNNRTHTVQLIT